MVHDGPPVDHYNNRYPLQKILSMAVDRESYQRLLDYKIPDIAQTVTARDTMLYALGIGLGADPVDPRQLRFVYEKDLLAFPTIIAVICEPHGWLRHTGTGFGAKAVAGGTRIRLHRPIPGAGEFLGKARLASVVDKGVGKAALVTTARDVYEKSSGELIATMEHTRFCRGDGGFGGTTGPVELPHALPDTAPEFVCEMRTLPQAALIYRLSGDYNVLHADPEQANELGFPRPNLHGLCTLGVACHALLKTLCGYDPSRLKSIEARYSVPVYPGETLRTEMWRDGSVVSFRTVVTERDNAMVLNNGRAEIVQ